MNKQVKIKQVVDTDSKRPVIQDVHSTRDKQPTKLVDPGGHPRGKYFKTPELLKEKIDEYFQHCDKTKEPYTITGMCVYLDSFRQRLFEYEQRDDYRDIIKEAKERVAGYAERHLYTGKNVTGAIFVLKQFGFKDTTEVTASFTANATVNHQHTVELSSDFTNYLLDSTRGSVTGLSAKADIIDGSVVENES